MEQPDARNVGLLSLAVLVLVVLHNDWWNRSHEGVLFGWLPFDLAYHTAWVAAGALVLSWVLKATWGREP